MKNTNSTKLNLLIGLYEILRLQQDLRLNNPNFWEDYNLEQK